MLTSGRVFNKVLSRWQKLSNRRNLRAPTARVTWEKKLKSGPFRVRFQHSGAKITVFEQNTEIIKFWNFWVLFSDEK